MKGWGRERARQTEKTKSVPFQKLFSFADGVDYILMLAGTVGAIGNGICMPLTAVLLGELVDTFGSQTATTQQLVQNVSKVSLKYVYLAVGCGIAAFLQVVCWMVTGERQSARIRCLYLRSILGQEIGYFDKETSSGEIMGRISGDTFLIQDAIGEKVGKFIQLVATFVGGFIIALIKGWLLTLVLLSSIPLLVISAGTMTIVISKLTSRSQDAYTEAAILVEETIASIRTVASFNGEGRAIEKYDKTLVIAYRSGVQAGLAAGFGSGLFMFVLFCTYAMAVWYGGTLILHGGRGGYTGGDVINVVAAVLAGSYSLGQASPCMSAFASGKVAAFKMLDTMSINTNNTDSPHHDMILINPYDKKGKVLLDSDLRGHIQLRDLYFSYPTRSDDRPVLSGLSLSIPSGATMALVGQSGSGKSTVISLLLRFYDPLSGHILIDGVNLKDFQLQWIRQKMGVVSQEPVLFSTTIKDNIAYGKNDATINEITTATQLANISNFIHKLPQGLETMVGEHGMQLSGGQKQRIAVARAILKDPRILLLDEATSALDAESERVLQQALDRVMVNRTTLVVAHRLTTVNNADMIAVIHQGKIVENGSHAELVQDPNGAYSQLIRLQEQMVSNKSEKNVQGIAKEITLNSLSNSNLGGACSRISKHWSSATTTAKTTTVEEESPEEEAENNNNNKNFVVPLCRLVYLNKPELPVLIMGSVAAVLSGLVMPVYGALLSYMIKTFYEPPHELRRESRFWALMFAILSIATLVAMPLRSYLFGLAGCRLIQRVRSMCFKRVVHMEMSWFDQQQHSTGAIGARLSTDAALLRALVGDTLALILQNAATAISGVAIAFQANWLLALIILAMVPLMAANGYLQVKFIGGFSADAKKLYEEATQVASDAVANIRTVASFCAEEKVNEMYSKKCEAPIKAGIKQGVISGAGYGFSLFLLFLVYAISFYAGSKLIRSGNISFPEVFRVFFGLSMATIGVSQSLAFSPDTSRAKIAAASVFAILDQKSKIDSSYESSGTTLDEVNGEIELRNVCFRYPTRPDTQVLRDVCLTIQPGKTVALVGESGSGKSTIIHLLQRFYEPNSGKILVDMVDIQQLNLKWLRQQMGLVSQEPLLFNQTIRYNIAYGCSQNAHVSETDVMEAALLANAHEFISGLEQGYETIVGERGIQLSGGQKQRIAIARAIVKAPKILLLDEATSALDAESERLVQEALDRTMTDRTTVVVAHRLSSVKDADLIVVLKDGVIAEKGNHQSLINRNNGIYASLVAILATVNKAAATTHSIPIASTGSINASQPPCE